MIIHRSNVYKLELTDDQSSLLRQWAGACRFVYNLAVDQRSAFGRNHNISCTRQQHEVTHLRREYDWIGSVPACAMQAALRFVDNAFQRFFSGKCGYPTYRKKFVNDSLTFPDKAKIGIKQTTRKKGAIKIPKVGWVTILGWRPLGGEIRSITVKWCAGNWFASVAWRKEIDDPVVSTLPAVGIDRGVKVFAALSTGQMIEPLNAFDKIRDKLAKEQHKLDRKKKFSKNWKKQKSNVTRIYHKVACSRKDYLHKLSTLIANNHGEVKIEKLQVKNMTRSAAGAVDDPGRNVRQKAGLNRSILDQGWSMFATMLRYKLADRGGKLIEVSAAYTSQTCAECGCVDKANRKTQSEFKCVSCGNTDNADTNAARNILQGRTLPVEPPKRILRRVGKRKHSVGSINDLT